MHDRLGQPSSARGEEHIEGVVKWHWLKLERRVLRKQRRPSVGSGSIEVGNSDDVLQSWQRGDDLFDVIRTVNGPIAVHVPIDRNQYRRLNLHPSVCDRPHPEFGSAGGPCCAEAGSGKERYEGFTDVGRERNHAIAPTYTETTQTSTTSADAVDQFCPGHLIAFAALRTPDDGDLVTERCAVRQGPFRVVQRAARKPRGAWHRCRLQ